MLQIDCKTALSISSSGTSDETGIPKHTGRLWNTVANQLVLCSRFLVQCLLRSVFECVLSGYAWGAQGPGQCPQGICFLTDYWSILVIAAQLSWIIMNKKSWKAMKPNCEQIDARNNFKATTVWRIWERKHISQGRKLWRKANKVVRQVVWAVSANKGHNRTAYRFWFTVLMPETEDLTCSSI